MSSILICSNMQKMHIANLTIRNFRIAQNVEISDG